MAVLTFDEFGGSPAPSPSKGRALTFDEFTPNETSTAKDIGLSLVSGIDKGVAGLAGLPADLALGINAAVNWGKSKVQGRPFNEVEAESDRNAVISRDAVRRFGGAAYHDASPLRHDPETTAGRYAQTGAEFIPAALLGPGNMARNAITMGVIPGVASEAAGQATEGTDYEPWARGAAAIAAGLTGHIATAPNRAQAAVGEAVKGATPEHMNQAEALFQAAQQLNLPITRAEALQHVTGGATNLGNLQRVVEGSGELAPFMAQRAGQVEAATRGGLGAISEQPVNPSLVGPTVSRTAQQVMREMPEGQILDDALYNAGPRTTPEQAGNVIQQDLRKTYEGREGMRSALADQDYAAARQAPETVPLDGGFGFRDVTEHYAPPIQKTNRGPDGRIQIMSDEARAVAEGRATAPPGKLGRDETTGRFRRATDEEMQATAASREQQAAQIRQDRQDRFNVTETQPVVGLQPTQWGQVDVRPVLSHLDDALESAKGSVKQVLTAAKSSLLDTSGGADSTIMGLHNSRMAINDLIDQAKRAGANSAASQLLETRSVLDRALESVPEYARARQNFQAASRPLETFAENRVPGQIIEKDQFNDRFTMPPERVPAAIENNSPSAARDFNSVASPRAREAFEQNVVTKVLDEASKSGADVSSNSIRQALKQNEDLLRQYPGVKDKLENVALAREGLAKIEKLPIGRLAAKDTTTKQAVDALFPTNPLPNSQAEISDAVGALAAKNPGAARQLVRTHIEGVFNEATQRLQSGANQFGGAGFAASLRGNSQQATNLRAAIEALPGGEKTYQGFDRLMNVLEAQGSRQRIGSQTSFNNEIQQNMKQGGTVAEALTATATGGLKLPSKIVQRIEQWRLGANMRQLADVLTNPEAGPLFKQLAAAPPQSSKALALVARLTYLGHRGGQDSK